MYLQYLCNIVYVHAEDIFCRNIQVHA